MYIYGASGHGKVVAEIAEDLAFPIEGFIDQDQTKKRILDYKVFSPHLVEPETVLIAIGNNRIRKKVACQFHNVEYRSLIHLRANISQRVQIGPGTVIMAGATVNADVKIGEHCIINTNASIDHDCIIEDYVHISPNAALAGDVNVGEGTHIGIGACVIQGIQIGKWCTVGAGAVIIRDIPDGATVVGNPGRIISTETE